MYRSRANLGRKRGHRAPAIRPGGTLGLSEAADSDAHLFQDSTGRTSVFDVWTDVWGCAGWQMSGLGLLSVLSPLWSLAEPRASRVPSSDEEVVEEPQNRRTRMSLGTKGLKVNLFPGLSPSALKVPSDCLANTSSHLASWPLAYSSLSILSIHLPTPFLPFLLSFCPSEGPTGPCAVC